MEKQVFPKVKPKVQVMDNILFRWIMLILLSVAAKILNKAEVMNIYTLVGMSAGHSPIVDNFHTELLKLMKHGENKNE